MRQIWAFIAGGIFGAGLLISGMTDTRKVIGWLDICGTWDPTLAFVMGGAVTVMFIAWRVAAARNHPALGGAFPAAPNPPVDRKLVIGSGLFGMGWGLAGLCPGPALASLSYGGIEGLVFLASMIAGMLGWKVLNTRLTRQEASA